MQWTFSNDTWFIHTEALYKNIIAMTVFVIEDQDSEKAKEGIFL